VKKIFLLVGSLILFQLNCETDHDRIDRIPDGTYIGTFQRQLAFGGGDTAHVTITFSSNKWTGQSYRFHYPALCHGTYNIDKNKIVFANDCVWTAEFDWTLILSGEYDFSTNGNHLTIYHDYSGPTIDSYKDNYLLTRQVP
jgi:hypothetical protein